MSTSKFKEYMMKAFVIGSILFFILLVLGILRGCSNMIDSQHSVQTNCKKTTLVVIGNKGHVTPVYECKDTK